jgi:DNA-binding response OmpR family regulator
MRHRILIVDDDEGVRSLFRLIFRREGFDVIEAADGAEAIDRALTSHPAAILLDVMMPGMDGFDTCRLLKNDPRTSRMPILFVSAFEEPSSRTRARQVGAADWIRKPISPRELADRVRKAIEQPSWASAS